MGLSSGLAEAAKNLKKDINSGVDIREAVLTFADKVEEAAETAKNEINEFLKSFESKEQ